MRDFVLGDRELDVMAVLWELRSGTVGEVRAKLDADLAYTTVLTILRNLEAKGCVSHEEEGRAFRYLPTVPRQSARRNAIARVIDKLFAGSPEALLAHFVDDHDVSADELRRIARKIGGIRPVAKVAKTSAKARVAHPRKGGSR